MKISYSKARKAVGEVQTLYRWQIRFVTKPKGINIPEDIEIRAISTQAPKATPNHIQVKVAGHTLNFAGKMEKSGSIPLQLVDGTDAGVEDVFMQWYNAYWSGDGKDTTGKQAKTEDLKADIDLIMLDGDDNPTKTYHLIGCLPDFDPVAQLGQDSAVQNPSVTFTYDDYHYESKKVKW